MKPIWAPREAGSPQRRQRKQRQSASAKSGRTSETEPCSAAKKSEEMIQQWIKDKQKSTYVRINEDWRNCDFTYPGWVR